MDSTSITVIKPGQLIDGLGGPPISDAAVVLQENLIHWIGSSEEIETNQEIKNLAGQLAGKKVLHVNATAHGGGVAERDTWATNPLKFSEPEIGPAAVCQVARSEYEINAA